MRIGQLADATGVTTKTLRYYETEGLLHEPDRTPSGYRDYPAETVDRLAFIRNALRPIRQILLVRDGGHTPCRHVTDLVDHRLEDVERRMRELQHTRTQLRKLKRRLDTLDPANCAPSAICAAIPATEPQVRVKRRSNGVADW